MIDKENTNSKRSAQALNHILLNEWKKIRRLTYDYLDMLDGTHLSLRLPFPESKPIGYQFWCMIGAHESYLNQLRHGEWMGFSCSLDKLDEVTPSTIKQQMIKSDAEMESLLNTMDIQGSLKDGKSVYEIVMQMIKHEMHHHGQLINLMFCHHLPIPASWHEEWALAYDN